MLSSHHSKNHVRHEQVGTHALTKLLYNSVNVLKERNFNVDFSRTYFKSCYKQVTV